VATEVFEEALAFVVGAREVEVRTAGEVVGFRDGATVLGGGGVLGGGVGAGTNSVVEAVDGGGPPPAEYSGAT
jgi:hypothetical protein